MKNLKLAVITFMFSVLFPLSHAHADSYAEFYTVAASGSTVQDTTFTLSQQPWLYIEYYATPPSTPVSADNYTVTGPSSTFHPFDTTTGNQVWVWYNSSTWNSVKTPGNWTIQGLSTTNINSTSLTGTTNFRITAAPEPVGTVLFLTGAFIMGIGALRRKKAFELA